MGSQGKSSNYHEHNDGSKGWDINIKSNDGHGKTVHRMHVQDRSGIGEVGSDLVKGIAEVAGSVFDSIFDKK
jgi:hypothetical protein